jgi:hypothetical protein
MEQLLNEQLTDDTIPVSDDLCLLAQEALNLIGQWSAKVSAGKDPDWQAQPFVEAAQLMRQKGKYQSIGHLLRGAVKFEPKIAVPNSRSQPELRNENIQAVPAPQVATVNKVASMAPTSTSTTPTSSANANANATEISLDSFAETATSRNAKAEKAATEVASHLVVAPTNLNTPLQVPKVNSSQFPGAKPSVKNTKDKKLATDFSEFEGNQGFAKLNDDPMKIVDQDLDFDGYQSAKDNQEIAPISVIDFELSEIEALVNTGENKKIENTTEDLEQGLDSALSVPASNEQSLVFTNNQTTIETNQLLESKTDSLQANEQSISISNSELSQENKKLRISEFSQDNQIAGALDAIDFENLDWQNKSEEEESPTQNRGIEKTSDQNILKVLKDIDLSLEDEPSSKSNNNLNVPNKSTGDVDDIFADLNFTSEKKSDTDEAVMGTHQEIDFDSFDF